MLKFKYMIDIIDGHTAGEPVRLVTAGLPQIRGRSMLERMNYFRENYDGLRKMILREPRGHNDMYGAVLQPPVTDDGDMGLFFIYNGGVSTMCGHATIGAVKMAVDTGIVAVPDDGVSVIKVDTPAGRVTAAADVHGGRAVSVAFTNVPSFVYEDGIRVPVKGIGEVEVAVAYGGAFMCFVEEEKLGLKVLPENRAQIAARAVEIKDWLNENVDIRHPQNPGIKGIYGTLVTSPVEKREGGYESRNVCVVGEGAVDRSPCGVGTSARMALLIARGQMDKKDDFYSTSILGTEFVGSVAASEDVCGKEAIIPQIKGSAYISGFNKLVLDPSDPLPEGFFL